MSEEIRRYLVLARFSREDIEAARACLMERIEILSMDPAHMAFSSEQGETVGVLMKSRMVAAQIIYALTNEFIKGGQTFIMVIEINEDWSGVGASESWEWLRHGRAAAASSERHAGSPAGTS